MEIRSDLWLSEIMDRPVYRLDVGSASALEPEAAARVASHVAASTRAFYYAKVMTSSVGMVRSLATCGFQVVDAAVTFATDKTGALPSPGTAFVRVVEAGSDLHGDILEIAASAFRFSRFHLDPLVPCELAHRIKREWVLNYTRGVRGALLLAAVVDGRAAGFLAVIDGAQNGVRTRAIDLIGVGTEFQRQGIGTALTGFFVREYRDRFDRLLVGTQAANIPSMRLYERCGFTVDRTEYVLHLHVKDGKRL